MTIVITHSVTFTPALAKIKTIQFLGIVNIYDINIVNEILFLIPCCTIPVISLYKHEKVTFHEYVNMERYVLPG